MSEHTEAENGNQVSKSAVERPVMRHHDYIMEGPHDLIAANPKFGECSIGRGWYVTNCVHPVHYLYSDGVVRHTTHIPPENPNATPFWPSRKEAEKFYLYWIDADYSEEEFGEKTPETLAIAKCAHCGKRPETLEPLPDGWGWDTLEPCNPWLWCPEYIRAVGA